VFAALVRSGHQAMPLATTLGALVEGAAAGLIGHAVVIAGAGPEAAQIAQLVDATGADLVTATGNIASDWLIAARQARGDWLLLLEAGEILGPGWIQAVERHALTRGERPGFVPREGWRGFGERLSSQMPGSLKPRAGLVIAKSALLADVHRPRPRVFTLRRLAAG
jgi:hypothetical protein